MSGGHVDEGRLRELQYALINDTEIPLNIRIKYNMFFEAVFAEAAPLSASEAQPGPTGDIKPWLSSRCRSGFHDKCRHSICDCDCHKESALSPEEKEAQRRSLAYGNTKLSNGAVTREMVDQEAEKMAQAVSSDQMVMLQKCMAVIVGYEHKLSWPNHPHDKDMQTASLETLIAVENAMLELRAAPLSQPQPPAPEGLRKEIGNVLDHWQQLANDIRSDPGFGNLDSALQQLYRAALAASVEPGATEQGGEK